MKLKEFVESYGCKLENLGNLNRQYPLFDRKELYESHPNGGQEFLFLPLFWSGRSRNWQSGFRYQRLR